MKILVTGANGYLGSGVVKQLLDDGMDVVANGHDNEFIDSRAKYIEGDLFDIQDPYHYFECPEVVFHMAWKDGFVHNSMSHINDFHKHANFIKEMTEAGIKRIAVMGSMHEVGFFEGCVSEYTPCWPKSNYGIVKNALRNITELYAKENGVIFQWLRGFYIVGNTERGSSIFSKITSAEKNGDKFFPFTMGQNQFDFIDYNEFCIQAAAAVEQDKINGIINICSGKPERLCDRVERFIKENGYKIKLNYGQFPDRPYDSKAIWGSCEKISSIINEMQDRQDKI